MTITWRGLGFLAFMVPLALWAIACTLFGIHSLGAMRVAFVLAALAVWFGGQHFNREVLESGDDDCAHMCMGMPLHKAVWISLLGLGLTFP